MSGNINNNNLQQNNNIQLAVKTDLNENSYLNNQITIITENQITELTYVKYPNAKIKHIYHRKESFEGQLFKDSDLDNKSIKNQKILTSQYIDVYNYLKLQNKILFLSDLNDEYNQVFLLSKNYNRTGKEYTKLTGKRLLSEIINQMLHDGVIEIWDVRIKTTDTAPPNDLSLIILVQDNIIDTLIQEYISRFNIYTDIEMDDIKIKQILSEFILSEEIIHYDLMKLNEAELVLDKYKDKLIRTDYYKSITIKQRLVEILVNIGNFFKSAQITELTINYKTVHKILDQEQKIAFINYLLDNALIEKRSISDPENIRKVYSYYILKGQHDPYSKYGYKDNKRLLIYNSLKMNPNGMNKNGISSYVGVVRLSDLDEYLNELVEKKIVFVKDIIHRDADKIFYLPSTKERVLKLIQTGIDATNVIVASIKQINADITTITNTPYDQENIPNILVDLMNEGYLEWDEDIRKYNVLKSNINPYLGLIPDPNNGMNKDKIFSNPESVFALLVNKYSFNYKVNNFLRYLYDIYINDQSLPMTAEIATVIKTPKLRIRIDDQEYNLANLFFDYGMVNKYTLLIGHRNHYGLNPEYIPVIEKYLDYLTKSSRFDIGFGWHCYHLLFNFITYALIDNNLTNLNKSTLIGSLENIPEVKYLVHAIGYSVGKSVSLDDILTVYLNSVNLNDSPINILVKIANIIKKSGKENNPSFTYAYGAVTIDFREFFIKNNGNSENAIKEFITILTWKHPLNRQILLDKTKNYYLNVNISERPPEVQLVNYMQHFWDLFAEEFYGDSPLDMFRTFSYILHYCDNSLVITSNNELKITGEGQNNTKFFDFLIADIQLTNSDIIVSNKDKAKIVDLLIQSLYISFASKSVVLGDPLEPNDNIGYNVRNSAGHIGGHSDSASKPPDRWVHLTDFIYRVFGDDWWVLPELKDSVGVFNVEYKNASSTYEIKDYQFSYFLGYPDPLSISSYELAKKHHSYVPKNNIEIAYTIMSKYINHVIDYKTESFSKFSFDFFSIFGGIYKSFVIFSAPIEYAIDIHDSTKTKKGINTSTICLNSLTSSKVLDNIHRIFKLISQGSIKLDNILMLFRNFGILIEYTTHFNIDNNSRFEIISINKDFLNITINNMKDINSNLNRQMNSILNKIDKVKE